VTQNPGDWSSAMEAHVGSGRTYLVDEQGEFMALFVADEL
jgi:hypothetical protein